MEAAIRKEHDAEIELVRGGGGIFDVEVDGEMIFSKGDVGRFPEESEILDKLTALKG